MIAPFVNMSIAGAIWYQGEQAASMIAILHRWCMAHIIFDLFPVPRLSLDSLLGSSVWVYQQGNRMSSLAKGASARSLATLASRKQ
jgi:hypothetical protein